MSPLARRSLRERKQLFSPQPQTFALVLAERTGAEEALDRLYSFDEAQIRYVDRLDEELNKLEEAVKSQGDVSAAIAVVDALAAEANEAFKLREDVLTNLDKSL